MRGASKITGRMTPLDLRWPNTPEFKQVAAIFSKNAVDQIVGAVWKGYEKLQVEFIAHIDISLADEELERTITQTLEPYIRDSLTGDEAYAVQHGRYETETRAKAPAQPPEYDIAFFLKANGRIMWPLEAKIMRSPANVAPYIKDINNEFLSGRYAPFTTSAAMLGYLLSGTAPDAIVNISKHLGEALHPHTVFCQKYNHHISNHNRPLKNKTWASGDFECHHMIMLMTN